MNRQEYFSKITERIPIEKFPIVMEDIFDEWFRIEFLAPNEVIWYLHDYYLIAILNLDESNPPPIVDAIVFGQFDPILGNIIPLGEIPDEIAEASLKALYPTSLLPLLLLGGALLLIPVIKKLK